MADVLLAGGLGIFMVRELKAEAVGLKYACYNMMSALLVGVSGYFFLPEVQGNGFLLLLGFVACWILMMIIWSLQELRQARKAKSEAK